MSLDGSGARGGNRLLDALPEQEYQQLLPALEPVQMEFKQDLSAQGSSIDGVYFPFTSVVSLFLHRITQRYTHSLFTHIAQQVACNGLHTVAQRCSRWLLMTHDRVGSDEFPITHDLLSQMLGVRRSSVTLAAGALQGAELIRYHHGTMTILDRQGLKGASCECYGVARTEFAGPV